MPEESSSPTTRKKIRWRRVFLWFFGSCIALLAVALLLLPKIAEKVIHGMIDDAGLEASSLDIQHIGCIKRKLAKSRSVAMRGISAPSRLLFTTESLTC